MRSTLLDSLVLDRHDHLRRPSLRHLHCAPWSDHLVDPDQSGKRVPGDRDTSLETAGSRL